MVYLKRLFALVLLCVPALVFAQDCKFDVDKKDPRTDELTRMVTLPIGSQSYGWKLVLEQKGDKYYMGLVIKWGDKFNNPIAMGDKMYFYLQDENKVIIMANKDYPPSYATDKHGKEITTFFPKGEIKRQTLEQLSKSPIDRIKVKLDGDPKEIVKIQSRQSDRVMEMVNCLLR